MFFHLLLPPCLLYVVALSNCLHIMCVFFLVACVNIVESSTHIVHCVWASSFLFVCYLWFCGSVVKLFTQNGYLFVYYYLEQNRIIYTNCALCLGKTIFLCLCKSLHLKKQVVETFGLKDVNYILSRIVKFATIYGLEIRSWFNFV
jgi:hypothetical protein